MNDTTSSLAASAGAVRTRQAVWQRRRHSRIRRAARSQSGSRREGHLRRGGLAHFAMFLKASGLFDRLCGDFPVNPQKRFN